MLNDFSGVMRDFAAWYEQYNANKKNQQDFGIKNVPARIFRRTIDLSIAGTLASTGTPFNGLQVEKIYSSSTGLSVDGSVKINLDRGMIDANTTYKKLVENDSFVVGTSVANAFLSWDAQAGVKADIIFFNDVEYRSGSQKTTVAGTVSVANTNATAIYQKKAVPTSVQRLAINTVTTQNYVIPAGFYGVISYFAQAQSATGNAYVKIGSVLVVDMNQPAVATNSGLIALAGETVTIQINTGNSQVTAQIDVYPI